MSNQPTSAAEARARVTELARAARICMLTTIALDGRQVSRPMGLQEVEFDGDLWFFASADSAKVRQLRVNPEVNVAFSDQKHHAWVSTPAPPPKGSIAPVPSNCGTRCSRRGFPVGWTPPASR